MGDTEIVDCNQSYTKKSTWIDTERVQNESKFYIPSVPYYELEYCEQSVSYVQGVLDILKSQTPHSVNCIYSD